jgi:hypothetical protein
VLKSGREKKMLLVDFSSSLCRGYFKLRFDGFEFQSATMIPSISLLGLDDFILYTHCMKPRLLLGILKRRPLCMRNDVPLMNKSIIQPMTTGNYVILQKLGVHRHAASIAPDQDTDHEPVYSVQAL